MADAENNATPNDAASAALSEGASAKVETNPPAAAPEAEASATDSAAAAPPTPPRPARELTGVVTSGKPDKTVIVRVDRRVKHPVYGKYIRRSTKLAAHDESNACNEGDTVTIRQTRPISKTKCWTLARIVERAGA